MKRLVFFCFCAAAALAIIPTGIASWEGGLSIESSFDFDQPDQPLLGLPDFAAPDSDELTGNKAFGENGGRTETEEQQGANPPGETGEDDAIDFTVDENSSKDNTPAADSAHNSGQSDSNSAASGNESGNAGSEPSDSGSSSSSESSSGSSETSSGSAGNSSSGSNEASGGADSSSSSSSGSGGDSGSSSSSSGSSSDSSSAD